jgi:hypothetical protein
MHFADKVLTFYRNLRITESLPEGVEVMNPYQSDTAFHVCKLFYERFYNDDSKRFLILGINPGRNGAGITGIPFTDPVKLETRFSISNTFQKKPQAVSPFIHDSMERILKLNIDKDVAFCLGEAANYKYLTVLNDKMDISSALSRSPHPRFIMQYKRKQVGAYLDDYLQKLNSVS